MCASGFSNLFIYINMWFRSSLRLSFKIGDKQMDNQSVWIKKADRPVGLWINDKFEYVTIMVYSSSSSSSSSIEDSPDDTMIFPNNCDQQQLCILLECFPPHHGGRGGGVGGRIC